MTNTIKKKIKRCLNIGILTLIVIMSIFLTFYTSIDTFENIVKKEVHK